MESRQKLQTFPGTPALNISKLIGIAWNDLNSYLRLSKGRTQILLSRVQVPPPTTTAPLQTPSAFPLNKHKVEEKLCFPRNMASRKDPQAYVSHSHHCAQAPSTQKSSACIAPQGHVPPLLASESTWPLLLPSLCQLQIYLSQGPKTVTLYGQVFPTETPQPGWPGRTGFSVGATWDQDPALLSSDLKRRLVLSPHHCSGSSPSLPTLLWV